MDNNTKKIAIGVGIIVLLLWFSKKDVAETSTEESGGGGGGGIGGIMPMGITLITTPAAATTTATTPANTSSSTTTSTTSSTPSSSKTTTTSGTPVKVDTSAPIDPAGGRGVYQPIPNPTDTSPTNTMNESVLCGNNQSYSVSSSDIKAAGGSVSWCNKNGYSGGSSKFVGFDGKIRRPSYKVDFS
jgi:hypothetical protein